MRLARQSRLRSPAALSLALGLLAWPGAARPHPVDPQDEEVVAVVNKENETSDISLKDLRSLLKLERRFWPSTAGATGGKQVMVYLRESGSAEQKVTLERVYEMSAEALEKYWVEKVYRGDIASPPATKGSATQAARGVGKEPGGISFMLKKDFNPALLKVLKIDGKAPGEEGYPLAQKK